MDQRDLDRIHRTIENAIDGLNPILDGVGDLISGVADAVYTASDTINRTVGSGQTKGNTGTPGSPGAAGKVSRVREEAQGRAEAPRADQVRRVIYQNQTVRTGSVTSEQIRKTIHPAPQAAQSVAQRVQEREERLRKTGTESSGRVVYQGSLEPSEPPKKDSPALYASVAGVRAGGIARAVIGFTLAGAGAACGAVLIFGGAVVYAVMGGGLILAGVPMGVRGTLSASRVRRFQGYLKELGSRTLLELDSLSEKTGRSIGFLRRDLKDMAQRGLFTEAHFDNDEEIFIVSDETFRDYQNLLEAKAEEERRSAEQDQELRAAGLSTAGIEIVKQGQDYIEKVQRLNAELPDPVITEKLSRLEHVIRRILSEVKKQPGTATELRRLMNYYLPTTWKLLGTYKEIEQEQMKTEQMKNTQKEIEEALDTINAAFENLLDKLFRSKAWDVSADISVLNTMLNTEGLTDEGISSFAKED